MPAAVASSQAYPSVWLLPDGTSNWRATSAFVPNTVVTNVTTGVKTASGSQALDGSNPTTISTGLTSISSVNITLQGSAAPGLGTCLITYTISGGSINCYAWKPTGSSNPTLIDSTGTETFSWSVAGA